MPCLNLKDNYYIDYIIIDCILDITMILIMLLVV